MKICKHKDCIFKGQPQPLENFGKSKRTKNGLYGTCKSCKKRYKEQNKVIIKQKRKEYKESHKEEQAIKSKIWREKNKDVLSIKQKKYRDDHKEEKQEYDKSYYLKNKEKILQRTREYNKNNKEKVKARVALYGCTHRKELTEYRQNKLNTDLNFKISVLLRDRFNKALKGNYKGGSAVFDLGCSIEDFKIMFISKFLTNQQGQTMTWENHGKLWHIDHIIPLIAFDLSNPSQVKKACHYSNLRPLWIEQNLSDGARGYQKPRKKS